jgi:hypothetical protein
MRIFELNIRKLFINLLPTFLRKPGIISVVSAVATGMQHLYTRITTNRNANLYKLNHTPQVASLEHLLNDRYDSRHRRIYITDGDYRQQILLYRKVELRDIPLYRSEEQNDIPLYLSEEAGFIDESFIVHIPVELDILEAEIRVMVDFFKLVGRKFKIVTF